MTGFASIIDHDFYQHEQKSTIFKQGLCTKHFLWLEIFYEKVIPILEFYDVKAEYDKTTNI